MGLPGRLLLPLLLGLASAAVAVAAEASEGDADPLYKYAPPPSRRDLLSLCYLPCLSSVGGACSLPRRVVGAVLRVWASGPVHAFLFSPLFH